MSRLYPQSFNVGRLRVLWGQTSVCMFALYIGFTRRRIEVGIKVLRYHYALQWWWS